MSLQRKFAILLALFAITVAGTLGAALWSFSVMQSEVSGPFESMAGVLHGLGRVKRELEAQASILFAEPGRTAAESEAGLGATGESPPYVDGELPARGTQTLLAESTGRIDEILDGIEAHRWYTTRAGKTTARNLRERLAATSELADEFLDRSATRDAAEAAEIEGRLFAALRELHELIERVELRIIEDAQQAIVHADRVRRQLLWVLGLVLASTILLSVLGWLFLTRWIRRPVADLRTAAVRIGAGDFEHRIPIPAGRRDEIGELSAEVNHMASMIQGMLNERVERERLAAAGEMVRRLVHNLRNPLSGIRGLAEITRGELPEGSDLRPIQERIIGAVDRFETWLRDLLSATRDIHAQPEAREVPGWVRGLVEAHAPMATTAGVRLELDADEAPDRAVFDARHLEQAVSAILSNAVEYTPRGRSVLVRVRKEPEGDRWTITVADGGPGVPEELREQVFRPYFTTKRHGNGIGLAVAAQVVRAHGGRISVVNAAPDLAEKAPGAAFTLELPLATTTDSHGLASIGQNGASFGPGTGH